MFYKIKSAIIKWFGDVKIYKHPFFVMTGHTAYKVKGTHQREILGILKPGDILLRRYDNYVSGLMIPGYYTHAGLYVGAGLVIHLLGDGVCKEDILTFTRCDNLSILRHTDSEVIEKAIKLAWEQFNKDVEYDFDFDMSSPKRFYCTEFVDFCYGYIVRSSLDKTDKKYIVPDDFLKSEFKFIWSAF
jgi:hypothetical protein